MKGKSAKNWITKLYTRTIFLIFEGNKPSFLEIYWVWSWSSSLFSKITRMWIKILSSLLRHMIFYQPLHYGDQKRLFTTGMAHFCTSAEGCTTSFDWASDNLSQVWVRLLLKKKKIVTRWNRTTADRIPVRHFVNCAKK